MGGLSWLLLAAPLLTLASVHARVRHCDCTHCDCKHCDCKHCARAFAYVQLVCLQPTNMSTLHTHALCAIVVAFAQGGSLLAGINLRQTAWEVCMCILVRGGSACVCGWVCMCLWGVCMCLWGGSACVCGGVCMCMWGVCMSMWGMCMCVCGRSACIRMCGCAGSATADARYLASSQEPDEELQSLLSYEEVCQKAIPDLKVIGYSGFHDIT